LLQKLVLGISLLLNIMIFEAGRRGLSITLHASHSL